MEFKLDPNEKSILANFRQFPQAEKAQRALQAAGFGTVQVDRIGKAGYNPEPGNFSPYHGPRGSTLSGITYFDTPLEQDSPDKAPLLAAMPEASGMAGNQTATGHGVLLTAVVPAARLEAALQIIRNLGGDC